MLSPEAVTGQPERPCSVASRAWDKIDAAGQQIKCRGACADDTGPAAKGLLKTDGVA